MSFVCNIFVLLAVVVAVFCQDMIPQPLTDGKTFDVRGGGGHTRGQGSDVYLAGQTRLYQSQNQRHEVHGGATYGQHIGGPYGSSRPNVGAGASYTYRFPG